MLVGGRPQGSITLKVIKWQIESKAFVIQKGNNALTLTQYSALVEAAFKYACAQRATDFYIQLHADELRMLTPLGYFPVDPHPNWIIGPWLVP